MTSLLRPCGRRRGSLGVLQIGYSYQTSADSPRAETVAIKQIAQILYELLFIEDLAANEDVDGFHAAVYARGPRSPNLRPGVLLVRGGRTEKTCAGGSEALGKEDPGGRLPYALRVPPKAEDRMPQEGDRRRYAGASPLDSTSLEQPGVRARTSGRRPPQPGVESPS
jgi:hypothetical protein